MLADHLETGVDRTELRRPAESQELRLEPGNARSRSSGAGWHPRWRRRVPETHSRGRRRNRPS